MLRRFWVAVLGVGVVALVSCWLDRAGSQRGYVTAAVQRGPIAAAVTATQH